MREPKRAMILRLLTEAQAGKGCPVSIGDALEFRRLQYELNAKDFSAILGITASKYSDVIHGRANLPLNARIRAFAIGVPADVLLQPGSEMIRNSKEDAA
jgi:transcriptional regulator with XRE-family HTH domain